ncbi:MAG: helix-turn-helix domain-containing protein [Pseudomonadales bacterium]|jgi:excisionase family DNA binding protein|nr:helix-turn-helix domain-containing protein [Pseudomonadales bacterium]
MRTYLTDRQVAERYNVNRTTVHKWAAKGVIPRGVKIGPGTRRWIEEELDEHDDRVAAQREAV